LGHKSLVGLIDTDTDYSVGPCLWHAQICVKTTELIDCQAVSAA